MEFWLRHERHGVKVCYSPKEAQTDEKNGWVRFDPHQEAPKRPVLHLPKKGEGKAA